MKSKKTKGVNGIFNRFSNIVTKITGRPFAFIVALFLIIAWGISGPLFEFSNTWQLMINTTTTIVTFLMVFVIQQSQNRDTMAIQLKLNELIASDKNASNRLIDVEDLTAEDLEVLKKFYVKLSRLSEKENDLHSSHSIDEASVVHNSKKKSRERTPNGVKKV
jgi:low affinity Fe/Cu permease